MKVTKTEVIISILIVLIIASITFLIPKPKLSQGCGDCTPWENGSCGLEAGCQIGEMKQGRECIGDIFSDEGRRAVYTLAYTGEGLRLAGYGFLAVCSYMIMQ